MVPLSRAISAACFLLALFIHPVISIIPPAAVTPALIIVGVLMMKSITEIGAAPWQAKAAAAAIAILIPLNFQIAEGIAAGCVFYTTLMLLSGQLKKVHWLMLLLSALFVAKFAYDIFGE